MNCPICNEAVRKHGRNRNGTQRFRCLSCRKTFSEARDSIGNMYLPMDKASLVVNLLVEGNSIRASERITGVHHTTILSLLKTVGKRCAQLQTDRVQSVPVRDLQVDEIWGFVGKKQARIGPYENREGIGDAYCFLALERHSKLTLAWHLGKRNVKTTYEFMAKVRQATAGHFQLSSDAFSAYRGAVDMELWDRANYAQIIKLYGRLPGQPGDYYRPARIKGTMWASVMGNPRRERVCTSHIERMNGSIRLFCKRLNRLTYAFSKRWEMLECALALHFAHYNFCRVHGSLRGDAGDGVGIDGSRLEGWRITEGGGIMGAGYWWRLLPRPPPKQRRISTPPNGVPGPNSSANRLIDLTLRAGRAVPIPDRSELITGTPIGEIINRG